MSSGAPREDDMAVGRSVTSRYRAGVGPSRVRTSEKQLCRMTLNVFGGRAFCVVSEKDRRIDVLGDKEGMLRCVPGAVRVTIGWTRGSDCET